MGVIASMTGYGRAETRGGQLLVVVEARSLNHRFLEMALKVPRGFSAQEPELRRMAQGRVARGRLDISIVARWVALGPGTIRADATLAGGYVREARALAQHLGLPADLTLAEVLRLPGVVTVEEASEEDAEGVVLLKEAFQLALDELVRMRQAEGAVLAADLGANLGTLDAWAAGLEAVLPAALVRIRDRVRARIDALLAEAPVDPARLTQEAATWAAKSDLAEELARLRSHLNQFRSLLASGGAVGRQLDFVVQEMHREVNTIAAKAGDEELVAGILEGRTVVERLREQVQNVE